LSPVAPKLLLACALAAVPAFGQSSAGISSQEPVLNFRLPAYTPEGFHAWLVRGSEARVLGPNEIEVKELTLTVFSGDAHDRTETVILSPAAKVAPADRVAGGASTIRIINDSFEATGTGWHYDYREKKVSIAQHVRVVVHGELKDLLK